MAIDSTIVDEVSRRGIEEALHFTTNKGALGILASGYIKSRELLSSDKYLAHIFTPNSLFRKDPAWLGYVNLSISQVNRPFFEVVRKKWHATEDVWWCIASCEPMIMADAGVFFATTNNRYSGVVRMKGLKGFDGIFAPLVHEYSTRYSRRDEGCPLRFTTSEQAEVLYPRQVASKHLRCIYVEEQRHRHVLVAQMRTLGHLDVDVIVRPELFP